jgi:hypothetical protein
MHLQFVILSFCHPILWSLFSIEIKYKFITGVVVYKRNACAYMKALGNTRRNAKMCNLIIQILAFPEFNAMWYTSMKN